VETIHPETVVQIAEEPSPDSHARQQRNSFGFLRFALACLVLIGHSYVLGGFGHDPLYLWTGRQMAIHVVGLKGFFILSGYLLTESLAHQPSLLRFTIRRLVRILPGFWVAIAVTAFVVAPVLFSRMYPHGANSAQSLQFADNCWNYFSGNFFVWIRSYTITPLFMGNLFPNSVNGSLWSLFDELLCYLALGIAALLGGLRRRKWIGVIGAITFGLIFLHQLSPIPPPILPKSAFSPAIYHLIGLFYPGGMGLMPAFISGVMISLFLRTESCWKPSWFWIILGALLVSVPLGAINLLWSLGLPYLLIWIGRRATFTKLEGFGNVSYGVYIYAFVIQQWASSIGIHKQGLGSYIAFCMTLSVIAGIGSWFLVERPSIRLGIRWIKQLP
jgi:peptidoglycan/LPS O-acetylase OafA/YrhL